MEVSSALLMVLLIFGVLLVRADDFESSESGEEGRAMRPSNIRFHKPIISRPSSASSYRPLLPKRDNAHRRAHYQGPRRQYQQHPASFIRNNQQQQPHRRQPVGRGRIVQHSLQQQQHYPRRPSNYIKPLQPPPVMTNTATYNTLLRPADHSSKKNPAAPLISTSSTPPSSAADSQQQSLLNLQFGGGEYLTYLYLPPVSQELDAESPNNKEENGQQAEQTRTAINTHQQGSSALPEERAVASETATSVAAPMSFDPYIKYRRLTSNDYAVRAYKKSALDSEADWVPISSPWKDQNEDMMQDM